MQQIFFFIFSVSNFGKMSRERKIKRKWYFLLWWSLKSHVELIWRLLIHNVGGSCSSWPLSLSHAYITLDPSHPPARGVSRYRTPQNTSNTLVRPNRGNPIPLHVEDVKLVSISPWRLLVKMLLRYINVTFNTHWKLMSEEWNES